MKLVKNMAYNTKNKSLLKTFCLKRRLKILENKRNEEIASFILMNPSRAAKTDNIENEMKSDYFDSINLKIRAVRRLLSQYSSN